MMMIIIRILKYELWWDSYEDGRKNKKENEEKNIENSPRIAMRFGLRNNDQAKEK